MDTHTDKHRKFLLSRILYGISPPSHPLTGVFALFITSALALHPLASSLPVSNSNQSVGWRGGGGGGGRGGHTKERPMGVSPTPDCGFCTLSLLTAGQQLVRDFSSYFDCLSPGKYYITHLFDWLEAHFHSPVSCPETTGYSELEKCCHAHVWGGSETCIK